MPILVVDDDSIFLKLITRQLHNCGRQDVITQNDPAAALKILSDPNHNIDLVICDLQMPGMDGVELIRAMADSHYRGGLILISGEDERILRAAAKLARSHRLNMIGELSKPVTAAQLDELLSRPFDPDFNADDPVSWHPGGGDADMITTANAGEITCYYQPKVRIATGEFVGVEAMARWLNPVDGLLPPGQFVATLEGSAIAGEFNRHILDLVLRRQQSWKFAGIDIAVSMNVALANLQDISFTDHVLTRLSEYEIPPQRLIIEITDSQAMENPRATLDILARLRLKGVGVSIHDHGARSSILTALEALPCNELKIDADLVHAASRNPDLRESYNNSLALANRLHLTSVAEGIRDLADWRFVRSTPCDLAQGYFIAPAIQGSALLPWLKHWKHRFPKLAPKLAS